MKLDFTREEIEIIKSSLKYTKKTYSEIPVGPTGYETLAFKNKHIASVEAVEDKIRQLSRES